MANGVAAGAQAGAAFGPWGAAIGGVLGGVSDGVQAAMGGPFKGGDSAATYGPIEQDHSGWTVNIGGGSASTNNAQEKRQEMRTEPAKTADQFAAGIGYPMPSMQQQAGMNTYAMLALAGFAVVIILKRRRK